MKKVRVCLLTCLMVFAFLLSKASSKSYQSYYNKFWEKVEINPVKANSYMDSALLFTDSLRPSFERAEAYFSLGYGNFQASQYMNAVSNYLKAKELFESIRDTCYLVRTCFNIGSALNMLGDNVGSINYYLKSQEFGNCNFPSESDAMTHYNMALLFNDLNLLDDAKNQHLLAVNCDSNAENFSYRQLAKLGLAYYYFEENKSSKAISETKRILNQSINDTVEWVSIFYYGYADLGTFYLEIENLDSAFHYFVKASAISDSLQITDYLITDDLNFASYFEKLNDFKKAIFHAQNALTNSRKINFKQNVLLSLEKLADLNAKSNNFNLAYEYKTKASSLSDTLYSEKVKYNYLTNALENSTKKVWQLNELSAKTEQKLTKRTIALVSALNFLFVVLVFFVVVFLQRRKLNYLNKRLEVFSSNKDMVIATLAHDIRSPLANIDGILKLIRLDLLTEKEKEEMLENVEQNVKNLNENLESLLNWSLSQMKTLEPRPQKLKLKEVIDSVIGFLNPNIEEKQLKVEVEISNVDLTIKIDEGHLKTILRNLLSNAIKFSHQNGKITIKVNNENQAITIKIIDEGEGIAPEDFPKILGNELFHKSKSKNGIGLGLRLTKEYVELNNGVIDFTSTLNKGTTFTVVFKI